MTPHSFLAVLCAAGLLAACVHRQPREPETLFPGENVLSTAAIGTAMTGTVDFHSHVRPILQAKCVPCHSTEAQPQGIRLENHDAAERSAVFAGFLIPGQPDRSLLLTKIKGADAHIKAMPPVGERVTQEEIALLRRWVAQGAEWPAGD